VPISEFLWREDRIDHIARHGVQPEEVEEVCFGKPLVLARSRPGPTPCTSIRRDEAARNLFCVVILFPGNQGVSVTARQMSDREKRRYRDWTIR
jgi:uncharacterized protein